MSALAGNGAAIYITSGTSVAFSQQACTDSGDATTFYITDRTKQYFDDAATFTVETSTDGGTTWNAAAAGTYTLEYPVGKIVFSSAQTGAEVRVSGKSFAATKVAAGHEWTITANQTTAETTAFGEQWKSYKAVMRDSTATIQDYYQDDTFLAAMTGKLILQLYASETGVQYYAGYTHITKDDIKASVDSIIGETVDFQITGPLYYSAV